VQPVPRRRACRCGSGWLSPSVCCGRARDVCACVLPRAAAALTVGATTAQDSRAVFSNYGACVDVFAPGFGIESAWLSGPADTHVLSGTSMAAPHVAGVVAQLLQLHPSYTPQQVVDAVRAAALPVVTNAGARSPNLLVQTPFQ
jgi:subtilisin family serine protease